MADCFKAIFGILVSQTLYLVAAGFTWLMCCFEHWRCRYHGVRPTPYYWRRRRHGMWKSLNRYRYGYG